MNTRPPLHYAGNVSHSAIRYISIRFSIWRSLFWRRLLRKHGWQRRRWTA